ncbi:MAG: Bifunctional PGK [Candidatus Omnitrophica bacterium ADurb.Bin292]|nr:MAG: Bifunctional PGK [Candidatus Omnitrophica bacterium ADurb.Bin292]HOG23967.1 triose-phosphate isomerase [Candidatus Omnitrophota bacterium]HPW76497.1 triose-phosphate isomerase [Candidatus Omnitrophota bacterium]
MKKKPLIAGNWKMYKTASEAVTLVQTLKAAVHPVMNVEIVICPPFIALSEVSKVLTDTPIELGAQNMYSAPEGAFTGEISPMMLKDVRCRFVILGHSERRQYFKEDNILIHEKVKTALKYSLVPIVCVGETLEEREGKAHFDVVKTQFDECLGSLEKDDIAKVVIAYEPVWAIGTGKTATPDQAEQMHSYIRRLLNERFGKELGVKVPILYGGSVKPDNARSLMEKPNIDGALVGGASLKAETFAQIVREARMAYESGVNT